MLQTETEFARKELEITGYGATHPQTETRDAASGEAVAQASHWEAHYQSTQAARQQWPPVLSVCGRRRWCGLGHARRAARLDAAGAAEAIEEALGQARPARVGGGLGALGAGRAERQAVGDDEAREGEVDGPAQQGQAPAAPGPSERE